MEALLLFLIFQIDGTAVAAGATLLTPAPGGERTDAGTAPG